MSTSGKEASRANSYKHGLTGSGIVLPEREAAEVQRRYSAYAATVKPANEIDAAVVLHAARMSVRMESCASHRTAMLTERVRKALADYEVPEGLDEAALSKLRSEVSSRAMFDPSPDATLARKYEASAERSFFRCLKELEKIKKAAKETEDERFEAKLASILPDKMSDEEFEEMAMKMGCPIDKKPTKRVESDVYADLKARADLPIPPSQRR
jgi:transcription initiation factor TFIIIB Brf1 subunit/transcription initiation factor TFIIB